jgi:3-deoxy-D-arabino-heptulosonate 7-phosphate (DAHP) synthase class II
MALVARVMGRTTTTPVGIELGVSMGSSGIIKQRGNIVRVTTLKSRLTILSQLVNEVITPVLVPILSIIRSLLGSIA